MANAEFDAADRRRLLELLPFYLNGRIAPADRDWVENALEVAPAARRELEFHRGMAAEVKQRIEALPADAGLERLMARVREDLAGEGAARRDGPLGLVGSATPRRRPGLRERLGDFLASLTPRPAWALAAAVIAVQAGVIGMLWRQAPPLDEYATVRSAAPSDAAAVAGDRRVLAISFRAEATEREIRLLLLRMEGNLVGGPGQLGEYRVAVPAARLDAARRDAEASGLVESVAVAAE